jgi:Tfp pilus assembly protein PilX
MKGDVMTHTTNAPVVRRREEAGSALILAALVTVILSLLGLSYLMMAQTENTIAENERNSAAALYVAEAGARLAIVWIDDPSSTGYLVPATSDMDRTKRIFDHDNNTATARVQGVAGDSTKPIYKDANFTASPVFDRPYRGSLSDTFLGIETGTDSNPAYATMGPDVILSSSYLTTVSTALFPNFPSVTLQARLTRVEIYAPPLINIGGTQTRMGIATVKAIAGVFQYPGTAAERQIATRIVKAVVNEIPVPGPVGPLQSCNNLAYNGDFQIHWGSGSAVGNAAIPSNPAKWPQGLPYAINDPFTYVQSPTLSAWATTQTTAGVSIEDPWSKFIAGGAIDQALNSNVQPFTVDYANPANDHSNLFQHTVINCPTFDYALWKSIAQSGLRNLYYYKWVSADTFSLDGSGPSTSFRTITDNQAGVFFFDTQDQLAPNVAGTNLTPAIDLSGGTYAAMGFIYLNAADFGTTGLGGRNHTVFPPGEPGDASGFVNFAYPGTLTGSYPVKSGVVSFQTFQDPETGTWYCTDAATCTTASRTPAGTPVQDSPGLPFTQAVMLDGVFYTSGTFEAQGNANYFGSVVAQRGVVDGGGTPNFWFDERLVKGQWPPKGMPLPRVVISAWETDL